MSSTKILPSTDKIQHPSIPELFNSAIDREAPLVFANPPQPLTQPLKSQWPTRLNIQRLTRTGLWLLGFTFLILWARLYGLLLLSTVCGIGTMIGVYRLPQSNWQHYWSQFCQLFSPSNRLLTLAVISGGFVALSTYWTVSLLLSGENIWVILSLILQNSGILAIACVLLWQFLRSSRDRKQYYSAELLTELTHEDALQRLIAVRKLTHCVLRSNPHPTSRRTSMILTRSQLAECFRLMLRSEAEPLVRNGLLDGLQQLD